MPLSPAPQHLASRSRGGAKFSPGILNANKKNLFLIRDSRVLVTFKTPAGCKVVSGEWLCPYTGNTYTAASDTDITRDHSAQVRDAVQGQFPMAVILSCVDSRIPVEDVFDCGIGDVFVARVARNFESTDILGSMEFATKVSGAKLMLVMGHEDCGAVKAGIDGAKLGSITGMLQNIKPAVEDGGVTDHANHLTMVCLLNDSREL